MKTLNAIEARSILLEILNAIRRHRDSIACADNDDLQNAVQSADDDMIARMQLVYPILCKIYIDTIANYGFVDVHGLSEFNRQLANVERDDADVRRLHDELRHLFMPPALL